MSTPSLDAKFLSGLLTTHYLHLPYSLSDVPMRTRKSYSLAVRRLWVVVAPELAGVLDRVIIPKVLDVNFISMLSILVIISSL